ncbi:group II intron reverse transcriptase/maturase [Edaphobacter modestus]|uniref:RNA-directed DNA polymerase n=2 Tax=Edaphobacter modestus TaxID=388466 RepID=A0A4Q7YE18_9BACT|nr:group II intron reverse transcriptase/maturase [Edaphobacter modestus]
MSLTTLTSVQKLQMALHAKAKESPDFRFYALYDKVYRTDVLVYAYQRCKANRGAAGMDNQTFEDIEQYGVERWLDELAQELKSRTYQPQPVRRVYIPKPDGKQRPLGIPTIRDRVVQTAAMSVLEPIFEADLQPEQYAYRADRSALDAVRHVHKLINTGHRKIVDADLSSYFDSVPHAELMRSVARRVVDGAMLHLIKMWLEAPVEETDEHGNQRRSVRNRDEGRGTPQGAPISPLLSNLYMRRFVLGWKELGYEARWEAYIVNYADDLVICCRTGAKQALDTMQKMMSKLKLTVNDSKTRVCSVPEEKFDFLGYTFGQCYSPKTGRAYLGTVPARKRVRSIRGEIREMTGRSTTSLDPLTIVTKLNRTMCGWANYFCLGPVSTAYRAVDGYAAMRLRLWLRTKHKLSGRANGMFPDTHLYGALGLVRLDRRTRNFPWAKA